MLTESNKIIEVQTLKEKEWRNQIIDLNKENNDLKLKNSKLLINKLKSLPNDWETIDTDSNPNSSFSSSNSVDIIEQLEQVLNEHENQDRIGRQALPKRRKSRKSSKDKRTITPPNIGNSESQGTQTSPKINPHPEERRNSNEQNVGEERRNTDEKTSPTDSSSNEPSTGLEKRNSTETSLRDRSHSIKDMNERERFQNHGNPAGPGRIPREETTAPRNGRHPPERMENQERTSDRERQMYPSRNFKSRGFRPICPWFIEGRCNSQFCIYHHPQQKDKRPKSYNYNYSSRPKTTVANDYEPYHQKSNERYNKTCKYFIQQRCRFGEDCYYNHPNEQ